MARPRTPIGTFGNIEFTTLPNGVVRARTRVRDYDGRVRRIEASGPTRTLAEHRLKERVLDRTKSGPGSDELSADSSFPHLVAVWLEDLDLEGRVAQTTRDLYERNMRQLVMPEFTSYSLREITVGRVDRFLKRLATEKSYSTSKQAKTVLSLAFGLAVRYEAVQRNPVRETSKLRKPASTTKALTLAEIDTIRKAVKTWRRGTGLSGPKPDGQLEAIIEVMLGTSARIGEVLAIRKCDVDVTASPATVRLCGTIITRRGVPTYRQDHGKSSKSTRTVAVPAFTADVLRQRFVSVAKEDPEHLLFCSRNHTPLLTNNVRRRLRSALSQVEVKGVTPHSFRRTVATVLDRAGGAELAAEMLGHTSSDITKEHYIEHDDKVNPVTAEILESLAPKGEGSD
ncbi:putative phage integrase [Nocardioides phosphati]|uniref:Phage integrase n=1 Tax=Nocardioides phosphati TaxID=1867775 RepID=A0ABQ2N7T2_9ACTN|nr:tyrosine-type recombinase/integrase [Nocardioides phosphati]GGO84905.1 putative phage integrase [Nocardioides phosphati]